MSQISQADREADKAGRQAIKRLSKPIKLRTLVAQFFVCLSALLQFAPYWALIRLGEILLAAHSQNVLPPATEMQEVVNFLLITFCLRLFFYFLALLITHFADMKLRFILREQIVETLSQVPLAWFSQHDSGQVRKAVQDDSKTVHTVIAHSPVDVLNSILSPLVLLIFLIYTNWRLALIAIATIPLYYLLYSASIKDMGPKTAEMNRHLADVSSTMVELVSGIKVVKAFSKTGEAHENYRKSATAFAESYWNWCAPLIGICSIAKECISTPLLLLTNLAGGALVMQAGAATLPQVIAATLIAIVLPNAIMAVASILWSYQMAGAAAVNLANIIDSPMLPETQSPQTPQSYEVEIEHVSYKYGETEALKDVSLTLKPQSVTALIGPSGSGKSTLATLIARFDDPLEGEIRLGGVKLQNLSRQNLYERVSFVLQDAMLLSTTIRRNISLAKPHASLEEVRRAARIAQIDEFILSLPGGYDSIIGVDCSLSGGEEQRIAIARAILADTPILILDEATAFADPDTEVEVQKALSALIKNRTVLVIAHRLNSILGADQIIVLEEGRITAQGTHEALLNNKHYQALLRQNGREDLLIQGGSHLYA